MCLGIPGEILSIEDDAQGLRQARVLFGGVVREANLNLVPEAQVGEYVIVHAGFAISVIDASNWPLRESSAETIVDIIGAIPSVSA